MAPRHLLLAFSLLVAAFNASAERVVYRSTDAEGKVTYSDRKGGSGDMRVKDMRVKNWMPANPGRYSYDAAVLRAESDRIFYARLLAERRQPVPVVIYDPRGWQAAKSRPSQAFIGGRPWRGGWDPNLPLSPAPSLERDYYYNGR